VLTINPYGNGSKEPLPIFSCEEEAEILLRFEAPGVKAGGSGKGVRGGAYIVLLRALASVRRVTLDPLTTNVGGEAMVGLVSLGRVRFLLSLVDDHEFSSSPWLPSKKGGVGWSAICQPRGHTLGTEVVRTSSKGCNRG
jgi:hypothetical protein